MKSTLFKKKGFTIDRLQLLVDIVEAGGLSKAAGGDETCISQYSRQVKELGTHLGFDISHKKDRRFELNEAGLELAGLAREFLRGVEDFSNRQRHLAQCCSIGAGEAFLQWVVMPSLSSIRRSLPQLSFRLRNMQNSRIVAALEDRTLDFGIIRKQSLHKGLKSESLGTMTYCLGIPPSMYEKAEKKEMEWLLANLPLATQSGRSFVQQELEESARIRRLKLNIQLQCDTFPDGLAALRTGAYAAILPRLPGLEARLQGLKLIDINFMKNWACDIVLAWNPRIMVVNTDNERTKDRLLTQLRWGDP